MTKHPYTALLIPDAGASVTLRQAYASAITALATGRAEARLIFKRCPQTQAVELIVLKHNQATEFSEMIRRQ